jgi:hypothetical protein
LASAITRIARQVSSLFRQVNFDGPTVIWISLAFDELGDLQAIQNPRHGRTVQFCPLAQFTGTDPVPITQETHHQGLDRRDVQFCNFLGQKAYADLIGFVQQEKYAKVWFHDSSTMLAHNLLACEHNTEKHYLSRKTSFTLMMTSHAGRLSTFSFQKIECTISFFLEEINGI